MKKSKNLVITNFKGGTGKTTTTVNLAHGLADRGFKVLAIDLDAQANLTDLMGFTGDLTEEQCISNSLRNRQVPVTIKNVKENLDLIGSFNSSMIGIETELQNMLRHSDRQLDRCLEPLYNDYDFIVLDLAPSLNALTINAYTVADRLIVPIISDYLSLTGFYALETRLSEDLDLSITDVIITKHESNTALAKEVADELIANRADLLFDTIIPKNVSISEQGVVKQSIYDYAPKSKGAIAYDNMVNELLNRINHG